ncbi:MAG: Sensor histidine kinase TodS [Syntrophus sp. PtaB.Bin001]|nr:MAG: Sensor histidine kinase TodS [Syntrophus sp. PtaB.Bin001]
MISVKGFKAGETGEGRSSSTLTDSKEKESPQQPHREIPKRPFRLGIKGKLIAIFVAIKVIPLILLCWLAWYEVVSLSRHIEQRTALMVKETRNLVKDVGRKAGEDSIRALDLKSREAIERLTTDTARQVADFLYQRDQQVLLASQLSPNEKSYQQFLKPLTRPILNHGKWVLKDDKWVPAEQSQSQPDLVTTEVADNKTDWHYRPPERQGRPVSIPIYVEMTFVGLDGTEKIKVTTVPWLSPKLQNITKRENTFCKAESYGSALSRLKPGEIYVSDVIGAYVPSHIIGPYTQEAARKKGIPFRPEAEAYAGKENPVGRRFQGLIRWATPVVDSGRIVGYVTLALDHTHLNEFTRTIVPTDERYTAINDAASGNYAFIWDYKGRSVCHPRHHSICGYDPQTGKQAIPWLDAEIYEKWKKSGQNLDRFLDRSPQFASPSLQKKPAVELTKAGSVGLDGRYLNFAPQCKGWHELTSKGGSGSFLIFWTGLWKLTTAATIPYYTGQYADSPRGFGYVTIGADVNEFHADATESAKQLQALTNRYAGMVDKENEKTKEAINKSLATAARSLSLSTLLMIGIVIIVAIWMAAVLTRRITAMISGIRLFQTGKMDHRLDATSNDEMGDLAISFNEMADELQSSIRRVVESELREKMKEKDALIAYNAGLFESASSYFHNIGNSLAGINGKLLNIRKVLESSSQYPEAFRMMREAHAAAVADGGKNDRTVELLARMEEILLSRALPRITENVDAIANTQHHMVQTIRFQQDMWNSSRQRGLKFVQQINLAELIENVIEDFHPTLAKRRISVNMELDRNLTIKNLKNPLIHGFTNVIKNAIEAIDATEKEKREISIVLHGKHDDPKRAVIHVADNGIGIRREDMPSLFQSGFTTKSDGHGLGLHSLLNFLNENNGSIRAVSAGPNLGAEFILEIGDE